MADLLLYTIFKSPSDYPGKYVVRRWVVCSDPAMAEPKELTCVAATLDEARSSLPPFLSKVARDIADDPCIVETWL